MGFISRLRANSGFVLVLPWFCVDARYAIDLLGISLCGLGAN